MARRKLRSLLLLLFSLLAAAHCLAGRASRTPTVNLSNGAVRFTDAAGRPITAEKAIGGRSFEPAVFEGKPLWHVRETFETLPGEAVTTVGDIRPYKPLSALRLFSENGDEGWLTATYHNDKEHTEPTNPAPANPEPADLTLPASIIAYDWLRDSKKGLPAAFTPAHGSVTWAGAIAAGTTGIHTFRVKYAGYIKVYIDGQLQLDRWRQPWNPVLQNTIPVPRQGDAHRFANKIFHPYNLRRPIAIHR